MIKDIICTVCRNRRIERLSKIDKYNYCSLCHTAWLRKFPKPTYDIKYYQGRSSLASKLFLPIEAFFYWLRRRYTPGGRRRLWIDVGAGEGGFLKSVTAKKKIGVEISGSARLMMREEGLHTLSPDFFRRSGGLGADVISFWHVLEHLESPLAYLKAARRHIAPRGKLVIAVPNIESFEFQLFGQHWFHLTPRYHLWHFSTWSIQKILAQAGFQVKKIDYWSPEHHLTGLLQSFINITSGSENVLHKMVRRTTSLTKLSLQDILWIGFWLTAGWFVVLFFWVVASVFHRSGTIVVVVSPGR